MCGSPNNEVTSLVFRVLFVLKVTLTFWAATRSLPKVELALIPSIKEEIRGFYMTLNFKKSVDPGQRNLLLHVV